MKALNHRWWSSIFPVAALVFAPLTVSADAQYDQLKQQVEALQKQLNQVQQILQKYEEESITHAEVKSEVTQLKQEIATASEWRDPNTLVHLAGYADVGYTTAESQDGDYNVGSFSPIFHYQYRDIVMLESELEFEVGADGETEVGLEYLTVDLFLNDYVTLIGGKFLSPLGSFRQNIHPSWINKLSSAPPGFGHDGAAPASDLGVQIRGGLPMGNSITNFAFYISNGPELNSEFEDGEFIVEGIRAEGFGADSDGEKVYGGRLGFFPTPAMEIGFSAAKGKASVTLIEGGPDADLSGEEARDYDVFGVDFSWGLSNLRLRGEYINSEVGNATTGVTASEGGTWESWYTQGSLLVPQTKFETVLRYSDFNSPHESQDQTQWAVGLNYLFTSSVIGKFTYEFNDGLSGSRSNSDRLMIQMAYGF